MAVLWTKSSLVKKLISSTGFVNRLKKSTNDFLGKKFIPNASLFGTHYGLEESLDLFKNDAVMG